ncbi:hypothetical protein B0T13DRAFT_128624 [Neurospora crassa]|nr:hypothetical protein B0T13DRAFT_128624 [Neurospora crassa]
MHRAGATGVMGGLSLHATTLCTTDSTTRCYSVRPIALSSLAQTAVALDIFTIVVKHVFSPTVCKMRVFHSFCFRYRLVRYILPPSVSKQLFPRSVCLHIRVLFLLFRHEFHLITTTEENKTRESEFQGNGVSFPPPVIRDHHQNNQTVPDEQQRVPPPAAIG